MKAKRREASGILSVAQGLAFAGSPLFGGDFPDFAGEPAGEVVKVLGVSRSLR
jgi:hypothetical protein